MAERAPRRTAARKAAAPRTKGTPRSPPKPRKVTSAAKPRTTRAKAAPKPRPAPASEAQPDWVPVPDPVTAPTPQWTAAPAPAPAFDHATGDWMPAAAPAVAADPAAYRKGATRSILLNIVLGLTLGVLAFEFLGQLVAGLILYFAPESAAAQRLEDALGQDLTPGVIIGNSLLVFLMMGLIPFLWVLGTRVVPWLGTVRFLQLRVGLKDVLRGIALVPVMLVAVYGLLVGYTCAVDGCDALTQEETDADSPMAELLENLSWPVVIIVALCAGVGEELFFRGVLQRWLGVWGQGVAFGLAHAINVYPPQVLFAFAMGVLFGYLFKRGWSLVSLMIAHFLYDFVLLAAALLYPDLG